MSALGDDQIVSASGDDAYGEDSEEFPEEFKKYMDEELSWSRGKNKWGYIGWIFWSRDADKLERSPDSPYCNLVRHAFEAIKSSFEIPLLIQYWAPTMINDRCSITTRNQPFFLSEIHKGLCGYRMISKAYNFYVDGKSEEELGLPGRVFLNKLPESTPNVKYYSSKEYPQRDDALRHNLRASWALPVFDAFDQSCVGVLELVTDELGDSILPLDLDNIVPGFKEVGLKCSDAYEHSWMLDSNTNEAFTAAKDEIGKVLKEVYKVNDLRLAQAWVLCSLCNPVVNGIPVVSYSTEQVLSTILSLYYPEGTDDIFFSFRMQPHLQLGQGVVGRAFLSRNMLFCTDVTQFSMSEYPLAHHARKHGLSGCFAICLQGSHTGNEVYVLEFILDERNRSDGELQTLLHNIVRTMKQSFKTLKLASGEELGEELPINVIDFHNGEKRFSHISPTTPRPIEALQNRPAASAESFKGSPSTLKRICRERNILRGPPHSTRNYYCSPLVGFVEGADQEQIPQTSSSRTVISSQASNSVVLTKPLDTTMQDDTSIQDAYILPLAMEDKHIVTVTARYGKDIAKEFHLSMSSGLIELHQQVANGLNVESGTYYIKYKDEEDELILIACDEDLKDYINTSRWRGRTWIEIFLVPK